MGRRLLLLLCALAGMAPVAEGRTLVVGSKAFTEAVILGEAARLVLEDAGFDIAHRRDLGGTRVLFSAVQRGDIDLYVEYSGTLRYEVFAEDRPAMQALRQKLAARGLTLGPPLGFNNTYALAMRADHATRLNIDTIADLARHPDLTFGFSNEFMDRADGWRALKQRYDLPQRRVQGLQHDLAYRAIGSGRVDVIDAYSTDAEIAAYDLVTLTDNRGHFPTYDAAYLYRRDLPDRAMRALNRLAGQIDADAMRRANAAVKLDGERDTRVAARLLQQQAGLIVSVDAADGLAGRLVRRTGEHLGLVAASLGLAMLLAIPLGIAAARRPRLGQGVLGVVGVLQTIPSLALLVALIPLTGIGWLPTVAMLFTYSLLPLVRNTHAGLTGIPLPLREAAEALGLTRRTRLWRVDLPLALPTILAGIKTAAVINVGTATLGALVGAGGYGQPILTGIRLDDQALILEGAIPSAALALMVVVLFDGLERLLVAPPLRGSKQQ